MNLIKMALTLALVIVVSFPLLAADTSHGKAVSVALVKSAEGELPDLGNVQVTYADGKTAVVTTDGRDSLPKVVGDGIVGWVTAIGHDPKYDSVKTVLHLKMPDGTVKPWECNALYIEDWGLVDGNTHLVIRSMEHHGNDFFIEYDLATGRTLAMIEEYVAYTDLPKWAKPYADSSN